MIAYAPVHNTVDWQEKPESHDPAEPEIFSTPLQFHQSRFWRKWRPLLCTLVGLVGTTALALFLLVMVDNKSSSSIERSPIPDCKSHLTLMSTWLSSRVSKGRSDWLLYLKFPRRLWSWIQTTSMRPLLIRNRTHFGIQICLEVKDSYWSKIQMTIIFRLDSQVQMALLHTVLHGPTNIIVW